MKTLREAFEQHVATLDANECWLWGGRVKWRGCPALWNNYREYQAVRVAWELFIGPIHRSTILVNSCGNKLCVNPWHTTSKRVGAPAGERNNRSLLTAKQVLEIRDIYSKGKHSHRKLGEMFGVRPVTISKIVNLQAWVDLKPPSAGSVYLLHLLLALPLYPSLALKLFPKTKKRGTE